MRSVPADQPRDFGPLAPGKKFFGQQEQSGIVAQKFWICGKVSKQIFSRANSSTCKNPVQQHQCNAAPVAITHAIINAIPEFFSCKFVELTGPLSQSSRRFVLLEVTAITVHQFYSLLTATSHLRAPSFILFVRLTAIYFTEGAGISPCPSARSSLTGGTARKHTGFAPA